VRLGQAAVVVDRGSNAEPADQAKTTTFRAHFMAPFEFAQGKLKSRAFSRADLCNPF
jgi:hypothetical protein